MKFLTLLRRCTQRGTRDMHRDEVVLQDILNAGRLVVSFVEDEDAAAFADDWKTHSAVLYQLTVMGKL